jgi:hypothetical protein
MGLMLMVDRVKDGQLDRGAECRSWTVYGG